MTDKYHAIAIALAGVCQNAVLVPQLANTGICNQTLFNYGVQSIFNTSPTSASDVFGGATHLETGLTTLIQILGHNDKEQMEIIRYVFGSLGIANKLRRSNESLTKISDRLNRMKQLYPAYASDEIATNIDELSYSLAGTYSDIISPLATKIKVTGRIEYLQNTLVQAKVRTALFASVRAAMLWYQVGGSRFQFLLARKRIIQAAEQLLTNKIN